MSSQKKEKIVMLAVNNGNLLSFASLMLLVFRTSTKQHEWSGISYPLGVFLKIHACIFELSG